MEQKRERRPRKARCDFAGRYEQVNGTLLKLKKKSSVSTVAIVKPNARRNAASAGLKRPNSRGANTRYVGTTPRRNTHRRVARRYSAAFRPVVIWNIQLAPSSYGMLKVARRPETTKNDRINGASISPCGEIERMKCGSRRMTNNDDRTRARPIPLYIAINKRCFALRLKILPTK